MRARGAISGFATRLLASVSAGSLTRAYETINIRATRIRHPHEHHSAHSLAQPANASYTLCAIASNTVKATHCPARSMPRGQSMTFLASGTG